MENRQVFSWDDTCAGTDRDTPAYRDRKPRILRHLADEDITIGDLVEVVVETATDGDGTTGLKATEIEEDPYAEFSRSVRRLVIPNAPRHGTFPPSGTVEKIVVLPRNPERPEEPVVVEFHLHEPRWTQYAYYRSGKGWIVEVKKTFENGSVLDTAFRDFWFNEIPGKDFVALPLLPAPTMKAYRRNWNENYCRMDKKTRYHLLKQTREK